MKNKTQHWGIVIYNPVNLDKSHHYIGIEEICEDLLNGKNRLICKVTKIDDARLIASAPKMLEALKKADQFISNGIDLGYINMPDNDSGDTALKTPDIIKSAISDAIG